MSSICSTLLRRLCLALLWLLGHGCRLSVQAPGALLAGCSSSGHPF